MQKKALVGIVHSATGLGKFQDGHSHKKFSAGIVRACQIPGWSLHKRTAGVIATLYRTFHDLYWHRRKLRFFSKHHLTFDCVARALQGYDDTSFAHGLGGFKARPFLQIFLQGLA